MAVAPAHGYPPRLNLGCGPDHRAGYLNIDMHASFAPDLVADVTDLAMLPSAGFDEVVAQDVLEHLPRTSTLEVLIEWNRLLRVGGTLVLRVPSLEGLAAQFAADADFRRHERLMQNLFGSQAWTGDFHLTCFTRPLLNGYLAEAGYRVDRLEVFESWLYDVHASKLRDVPNTERDLRRRLMAIEPADACVDAVYRTLLNRAPDPGGRAFYLDALQRGMMSKAELVGAFLVSPERAHIVATERVTALFREYLGRDPDAASLAHYRDGLLGGRMTDSDLRGILGQKGKRR